MGPQHGMQVAGAILPGGIQQGGNARERPNLDDCEIYGIGVDGGEADLDTTRKPTSTSVKDLDETCPWDAEQINPCKTTTVAQQLEQNTTKLDHLALGSDAAKSEESMKIDGGHLKPDGMKRHHRSNSKRRRERKKSVTTSPGTCPILEAAGTGAGQPASQTVITQQLGPNSDNNKNNEDVSDECGTKVPRSGQQQQLCIKYQDPQSHTQPQLQINQDHPPAAQSARSHSAPGGTFTLQKDVDVSPLNRKKTKNPDEVGSMMRKGSVNSSERKSGGIVEVPAAIAVMCSIATAGHPIPSVQPSSAFCPPTVLVPPLCPSSAMVAPLALIAPSISAGEATVSKPVPTAAAPIVATTTVTTAVTTTAVVVATAQTQTLARESSSANKQRQRQGSLDGVSKRSNSEEHAVKTKRQDSDASDQPEGARALDTEGGVCEAKVETVLGIVRTTSEGAAPAPDDEDEAGRNGCWIAPQDVCPWEDDSLTPTWL
jgi:hypothetical protein